MKRSSLTLRYLPKPKAAEEEGRSSNATSSAVALLASPVGPLPGSSAAPLVLSLAAIYSASAAASVATSLMVVSTSFEEGSGLQERDRAEPRSKASKENRKGRMQAEMESEWLTHAGP